MLNLCAAAMEIYRKDSPKKKPKKTSKKPTKRKQSKPKKTEDGGCGCLIFLILWILFMIFGCFR